MAAVLKEHPDTEFGAPALKRHKRRRTNAYNRRKQFKRSRNGASKQEMAMHAVPTAAVCPSSDLPSSSKAQQPAGTLQNGCEQDSNKKLKYSPDLIARYELGTNRRMRRDSPDLQEYHNDLKALLSTESIPRCLPSHAFLCTRFVMGERAGWKVPVHACGKGHRKHKLKHAMLSAAVLNDRSHWPSLRIHGQSQAVGAVLSELLAPHPFLSTGSKALCSTSAIDGAENEQFSPLPCSRYLNSAAISQLHDSETAKLPDDLQAHIRACCASDRSFRASAWLLDTKQPTQTALISPCVLDISHPPATTSVPEPHSTVQLQSEGPKDWESCRQAATGGAVAVLSVHPAAEEAARRVLVRACNGGGGMAAAVATGGPQGAVWTLTGRHAERVVQTAFSVALPQQAVEAEQAELLFKALVGLCVTSLVPPAVVAFRLERAQITLTVLEVHRLVVLTQVCAAGQGRTLRCETLP